VVIDVLGLTTSTTISTHPTDGVVLQQDAGSPIVHPMHDPTPEYIESNREMLLGTHASDEGFTGEELEIATVRNEGESPKDEGYSDSKKKTGTGEAEANERDHL